MGDLASHLVNLIKWTEYTMDRTEFDLAAVPPGRPRVRRSRKASADEGN
jgi:hypothetical protein